MIKKIFSLPNIILISILIIGLSFRLYKLEVLYAWGHDQDLFAWIAKDIVVDHHFRLIGQETSITGVFIGPIFYYLVAISMALFNMNPIAAYIPVTIISVLTIFSIYWVFNKFFGQRVALIGAFLYAISPEIVLIDRWIVPTQTTNIWSIWFMYALLSILEGKTPILIISILIGLIWHVHIALIPLIVLFIIALLVSRKKQKNKIKPLNIIVSLILLFILLIPLLGFEIRHNFQQTKALIQASYENKGEPIGTRRLNEVLYILGRDLSGMVLLDKNIALPKELFVLFPILLIVSTFIVYKTQRLNQSQFWIFLCWIGINILSEFISKRPISEYYFSNLFMPSFLILAFIITLISNRKFLFLGWLILILYSLFSVFLFFTQPDDQGSFYYKKKTIEYIKNNSEYPNFPCIAINYIEGQKGLPNGFRYLSWYFNLKVITGGGGVPVYSIVTPWTISKNEINIRFGNMGIIVPSKKEMDPKICSDSNRQLLPLWGFNN